MKKYLGVSTRGIMISFLLVVLASTLPGCTTTLLTPTFTGKNIRPGFQIALESDGTHSGLYQSDDLSVHYRYTRKGDSFKIAGTVSFATGTVVNFNYVDYFNLGLLIGDSDGKILSNNPIVSTSWVNLTLANRQVHFSRSFDISPNAAVMAFTYTGQATEGGNGGGENGGGNIQFWQYPIVK